MWNRKRKANLSGPLEGNDTIFYVRGVHGKDKAPQCALGPRSCCGDGTACAVLLRHQHRLAALTSHVSKVILLFHSWGKSAEWARLCLPLLSATHQGISILTQSEKVKSIISAPEVAGCTVSQLVCSESQFWVCWEKKIICVLCECRADQLILDWNGFTLVSKAGQNL